MARSINREYRHKGYRLHDIKHQCSSHQKKEICLFVQLVRHQYRQLFVRNLTGGRSKVLSENRRSSLIIHIHVNNLEDADSTAL